MKPGTLASRTRKPTFMANNMSLKKKNLGYLLLAGLLTLGISACSEQTPTKVETLTYTPIGPTLDRNYRVNGLYVINGNAYLPIAGRTDGPLRYAQMTLNGAASTNYKIVDLLIPNDASYKIVGPVFVDGISDRIYAPLVITDRTSNTYTWLTYDTKGLTPIGTPLGNYPVPSNPELQFGVPTPGFYKGVLYPNYAGNLVGINTTNGQQVFQKKGLLAPTQSNYAVIENQILTFSRDSGSMTLIDMSNGSTKTLGGDLNALAEKGYQATPFFAIFNGNVHLLTIGTGFKLGLCTTSLHATEDWRCKLSDMALPAGVQITAFNLDPGSGTPYFLTYKTMNGTQLNRINLP